MVPSAGSSMEPSKARRTYTSFTTKTLAIAAATKESLLPIERMLARLAATSRESLANAIVVQRRASLTLPDLDAATVPKPSTRSRMPIVRRRRSEAPVGGSRFENRNGGPGATINAAPTAARTQPMRSLMAIGTVAAYLPCGTYVPINSEFCQLSDRVGGASANTRIVALFPGQS